MTKQQTYIDYIITDIRKGLNKSVPQRGYYVYAILENGEVCYIGKGKKNRVLDHFKGKGNKTIFNLYKTTSNEYDWTILEIQQNESESLERERYYINLFKANKTKLYNVNYNTKDYVIEKTNMVIKSMEYLINITSYMYKCESDMKEVVSMSLNVAKHLYSEISDKVKISYFGVNVMDLTIKYKFYKDSNGQRYAVYSIKNDY